jgi:hypothetical protein
MSDLSENVKITSFGIWLVENKKVEEYLYSNIRHKNEIKEHWKYARNKET